MPHHGSVWPWGSPGDRLLLHGGQLLPAVAADAVPEDTSLWDKTGIGITGQCDAKDAIGAAGSVHEWPQLHNDGKGLPRTGVHSSKAKLRHCSQWNWTEEHVQYAEDHRRTGGAQGRVAMAGGYPESLQGSLLRGHTNRSSLGADRRSLCAQGAVCSNRWVTMPWAIGFRKLYHLYFFRGTQSQLRGWHGDSAESDEELYTSQLW